MQTTILRYFLVTIILLIVLAGCTTREIKVLDVSSTTPAVIEAPNGQSVERHIYTIFDYSFEAPSHFEVQLQHPEIIIFQNTIDLVGNPRLTPNALTVTTNKGQLRALECGIESKQPITSDVFNRYEERRCPNTYNPTGQSLVYYFASSYTYATLYMELQVDGGGQALLFEEVLRSSVQRR